MPPASPAASNEVLYIISVHGMGEQDSSLPILNALGLRYEEMLEGRLSVVRLPQYQSELFGQDIGTAAVPWLEVAKASLRVSDVPWADIRTGSHPLVNTSNQAWINGLISRLFLTNQKVPYITRKLIEVLAATLGPSQYLWGNRGNSLRELFLGKTQKYADSLDISAPLQMLLDQYMRDVQLYTEYPEMRGAAVRRFHEVMTRMEYMHCAMEQERIHCLQTSDSDINIFPRTARYVFLTHSIGTAFTIDALVSAALPVSSRCQPQRISEYWPWPSYVQESVPTDTYISEIDELRRKWELNPMRYWEEYSSLWRNSAHYHTGWIGRVDRLVTIGSPIDKFLTLWWGNYLHLNEQEKAGFCWSDPARLLTRGHRIIHDNYYDEQDPIGGQIDVLRTSSAYNAIFGDNREQNGEDIHFVFSPSIGHAHVGYFNHKALWRRIKDRLIGNDIKGITNPSWSLTGWSIGIWIFTYTYLILPMTGAAVLCAAYVRLASSKNALFSIEWVAETLLSGIIIVAGLWIGRRLIELSLWWRILLRARRYQVVEDISIFDPSESTSVHATVLIVIASIFIILGSNFELWRESTDPMITERLGGVLSILLGLASVSMCIAAYYHFATPESVADVGLDQAAWSQKNATAKLAPMHQLKLGIPRTRHKHVLSPLQWRRLSSVFSNDVVPLAILARVLFVTLCSPLDDLTRHWLYWTGVSLGWVTVLLLLIGALLLPWLTRKRQESYMVSRGYRPADSPRKSAPNPVHVRWRVGATVFGIVVFDAALTFLFLPYFPSPLIKTLDQRTVLAVCIYLFMYWTVVKFWEINARIWKNCGDQPSVPLFGPYAKK